MTMPLTSPANAPTATATSTITSQVLCDAAACTLASVATTVVSPITDPTERSMPPAVITNVMPMLMTPMIEAKRMMVRKLLTLVKRSPALIAPTSTMRARAMTSPRLRPAAPPMNDRTRAMPVVFCSVRVLLSLTLLLLS